MTRTTFLFAALLIVPLAAAADSPSAGRPLAVRILYDGSGSMYPGYRPPGSDGRRTKAELGVDYFHQYPDFRQWLAGFVQAQTSVDAATVGMWVFTSDGAFTPADIREVHPEVPPNAFDVERALKNFPDHAGQTTYLTETLATFTRDFTGLVWLITDNIVETSAGQADADVERFFRTLNDQARFRSVHLFKYPFTDNRSGETSALAVYGILVSPRELPQETLSHYDRKFRSDLRALFPGQEHLKLKDLRIDPLELHTAPTLTLILDSPENGMFKEGQRVQLGLAGEIKSNLTQHSVTAGKYELSVATPFAPEPWAQRDLGLQALPAEGFDAAGDSIRQPIPPNGLRQVSAILRSAQPVSFKPSRIGAWFRLAMNGAVVKYTGTVRMSFRDINVKLERAQMAGIFGIDRASSIFDFQDVRTLDRINPSDAKVSFALKTGAPRTAILLALLAVVSAVAGTGAFLLARPQWYRIEITGTEHRLVPLRRLGSHAVRHGTLALGHLSRDLFGGHSFVPNVSTAALEIRPSTQPDTWDVRPRDGRPFQLSISARNGRKSRPTQQQPIRSAPMAPRPTTSATDRPMPKLDRP